MLISEVVNVKWNGRTKPHYLSKGYKFTKMGELFEVKVEDLTVGANVLVDVICDYCGELIPNLIYKTYNKQREKSAIQKDCCKSCSKKKIEESNIVTYGVTNIMHVDNMKQKQQKAILDKYGVTNISKVKEFQEKKKATSIEKYGVDNYSKTEEYKIRVKKTTLERYGVESYTQTDEYNEKVKQKSLEKYGVEHHLKSKEVIKKRESTVIEKYGVSNVFQNEVIKEKSKETLKEKYGVEHYSKTDEFKQTLEDFWEDSRENGSINDIIAKRINTNLEKYGKPSPMQAPHIAEKARKTMMLNNNVPTSKQQIHIHSLIGGELNYPVDFSSFDIAFPNEKIYFEYDGGGHDLGVKIGRVSEQDFINKEKKRYFHFLDKGWKCIRLISPNDILPSDDEITRFVEACFLEFNKNPLLASIKWYVEDNNIKKSYRKEVVNN